LVRIEGGWFMVRSMNRTFTPELDPGTLQRVEAYAAHCAEDFSRPRQRAWCGVCLAGLLQDGERKSIEPISPRVSLTKGEIALELLDAVRAEGVLPSQLVVADYGCGVSGLLRAGLAERGFFYVVGVTGEMMVFVEEPRWLAPLSAPGWTAQRAAPASLPARRRLRESLEPARGLRADALAQGELARGNQGADGRPLRLAARVARPRLGRRRLRPRAAHLAFDRRAARRHTIKHAFSNLPADTSRIAAVRLWRERWKIERAISR
jgi:SRSO17 transposase